MTSPYQELIQRFGVTITSRDIKRLTPSLSNWPKLNELLILGVTAEDLKKLILVEMNGKRRRPIISRLCARLKKQELKQLRLLIDDCLRHGR